MLRWEEDEVLKLYEQNGSVRQTAKIVRRRYDDVRKVIKDDARREVRAFIETVSKKTMGIITERKDAKRVVGVIGDLHCPFEHKGYIEFLKDTFEKHKVTDVVFIGDICDNHAISRHQTEPSAKGATREYEMAYESLRPFVEAFPKAMLCHSNHDSIPERQIATLGMPTVFIKKFKDLWGLPDTWEYERYFIIDDVYYHHGLGANGINGAINKALNERMSVVQGHQHSVFNIEYRANARDLIFGMSVGCGVNNDLYAFEYGKFAPRKPVLGCGIVKSSSEALLVPMGLKYFGGEK